jgi:hypothetical protein
VTACAHDPTRAASSAPEEAARQPVLSLSEIDALCTRAARGAGFAWGQAEEVGRAAVWLARAGLAGPEMLCRLLEEAPLSAPSPAVARWRAQRPLCPLRCGMALQDHACLPEGPGGGRLVLEAVAHPGLMLAFAAQAARHRGMSLRLGWPGAEVVLTPAGAGGPTGVLPSGDWYRTDAAEVTFSPADAPEGLSNGGPATHCGEIGLGVWHRLEAFSLRTTVPASDGSRAGAGAGASDND